MIFPEAMSRGLARGLAGVLLLAFGAQAAHARGETSVWSMKGERNTVYLAGSVHALPKDDAAFPEQLERAYQAAEVIVLEVDLDDMNPLDAVKFITTNGTLPADQSLEESWAPSPTQRISKLAASLEVPEIVIAKLEPWAAALVLTQFALTKTGFDATSRHRHADHRTRARRWQAHRGTRDRHRPAERLRSIAASRNRPASCSTPPTTCRKLNEDLQKLIAAWRTGDLRALEKEFVKERAKSPELYDALLGARNRQWLPKIEALLKEDRDYLVVVGALHFVGRDGLLALLRKRWPQGRGGTGRQEQALSSHRCAPSRSSSG